jgi:hypothetical protein
MYSKDLKVPDGLPRSGRHMARGIGLTYIGRVGM